MHSNPQGAEEEWPALVGVSQPPPPPVWPSPRRTSTTASKEVEERMRDVSAEERRLLGYLEALDPLWILPTDSQVLRALHPFFPTVAGAAPPLVPMDGCQVLVSLLAGAALKDNMVLMLGSLQAMGRLTSQRGPGPDAANRARLGAVGACRVVLEILSARPADRVLLRCLMVVTWYLSREDANMEAMEAGDGYQVLHDVMRAHPSDLTIQSSGCAAIGNLAHSGRAQRRLGELGTCELVVAALRCFPQEAELQSSGWAAVTNLTGGFISNQNRLMAAGACELLALTMRTFAGNKDVQDHCCGAVTNLCGGVQAVAQRLADAGVGELILDNLATFPDDPGMQYAGLGALTRLASDSPGAREALAAKGATERILAALRTFPLERDVQTWGCDAVGVFAEDFDVASQLGMQGACEAVVDAMHAFYSDPELPDFGNRAVTLLATRLANKETFRRIGAKNAIERATNARIQDEELYHRAMQALMAIGDWGLPEDFDR